MLESKEKKYKMHGQQLGERFALKPISAKSA